MPKFFTAATLTALLLAVLVLAVLAPSVSAREWNDPTGRYSVEGELVSGDSREIVVETEEGRLIVLKQSQLSAEDRKFVESQLEPKKRNPQTEPETSGEESSSEKVEDEPAEQAADADNGAAVDDLDEASSGDDLIYQPDVDSVWHLSDGQVVKGQLEGFGRQELVLKRMLGDLLVNDRPFESLPPAYRLIVPDVVSHVENIRLRSLAALEEYLTDRGGGPIKYYSEGVQLDLKSFGRIVIPIGLLAEDEKEMVESSFKRWKAAMEDEEVDEEERYETARRGRLVMDSYQRSRRRSSVSQARPSRRQMQWMELQFLAAGTTNVNLWEVTVVPPYAHGYPVTTVVPAENSLLAQRRVAMKYPGWNIGPIVQISE